MMMDRVNGALRRVPVWLVYLVAVVPPVWIFYAGVTGRLGVEPIKEMEHQIGLLGLQVLIATLAVTPLRRLVGLNLMKFRRAMGLIGFFYIFLHLLVWLLLDVRILGQIVADILKRPYITIGMVGFVLMVPLALTSNNLSVRKLGRKWRVLHKLVYLTLPLGALHFVMLRKGFQIEPLIYAGVVGLLLVLRIKRVAGVFDRKAPIHRVIPRSSRRDLG